MLSIFFRPQIQLVTKKESEKLYSSQSKNASAKTAIIIQEFYLNVLEQFMQSVKWHRLPNFFLSVYNSGFTFALNNFFFDIVDETVQLLTSAGIMNQIIKRCFVTKKNEIELKEAFVLKLKDLNFGFMIWLGCCAVCGTSFVTETIFWYIRNIYKFLRTQKKPKKIKFMKIHPQLNTTKNSEQKVKKNENLFRVQKLKLEVAEPNCEVDKSIHLEESIL